MGSREPLTGWAECELSAHPSVMTLSVEPPDDPDGVAEWAIDGQYCVSARVPGGTVAAQLAAEDAARAMVAEMAAALGGRVVWGPVCPFCSFGGADVGVDGQMQCAGCGALGVPADAADAEGVHP